MEFRFVAPDLHRLDETPGDLVACGVFEDRRPVQGLAGLLDWRLAGRLSQLLARSFAQGSKGEPLLLTARPRLRFDKMLVLGLGPRDRFNEGVFAEAIDTLLRIAGNLRANKVVVELPGRGDDVCTPTRAADLLVEMAPSPF